VTAFLRSSLFGDEAAWRAVADPAGALPWLSADEVVVRHRTGEPVVLAGFAEDVDPLTATLEGATLAGEGLALWREGLPSFRRGVTRQAPAVTLGWRGDGAAYHLTLPHGLEAIARAGAQSVLRLDVARGTVALPGSTLVTGPLDASVVLVDGEGRRASVPLSAVGGIPTDFPARVTRWAPFEGARYTPSRYPLFRTLELPLSRFLEVEPELDLGSVREIVLAFDRVREGVVVLRSIELALRD
jgi:hypothetical protein